MKTNKKQSTHSIFQVIEREKSTNMRLVNANAYPNSACVRLTLLINASPAKQSTASWSHSRESGNPGNACYTKGFECYHLKNLFVALFFWIPSFEGMTPWGQLQVLFG